MGLSKSKTWPVSCRPRVAAPAAAPPLAPMLLLVLICCCVMEEHGDDVGRAEDVARTRIRTRTRLLMPPRKPAP